MFIVPVLSRNCIYTQPLLALPMPRWIVLKVSKSMVYAIPSRNLFSVSVVGSWSSCTRESAQFANPTLFSCPPLMVLPNPETCVVSLRRLPKHHTQRNSCGELSTLSSSSRKAQPDRLPLAIWTTSSLMPLPCTFVLTLPAIANQQWHLPQLHNSQ